MFMALMLPNKSGRTFTFLLVPLEIKEEKRDENFKTIIICNDNRYRCFDDGIGTKGRR